MAVRTLYSGRLWVAYSQACVESGEGPPPMKLAFGGQANGLCGAAVRGALFLMTGTHTGRVGFAVERHDGPPPRAAAWDDVVEVSFSPLSRDVVLAEWGGGTPGEGPRRLDLPAGDWRVRYCAAGLDVADTPVSADEDEPVDRYLLQFWPAPPSADRVVRQTSGRAASWHAYARRQPPPPPPPTPEDLAEARRRKLLARRAARERWEVQTMWGGRPPSDRLRRLGGNVRALTMRDRDLVDQLERAGPAVQRAVAVWAAHQASEVAGLTAHGWVTSALDALDRGAPLPPPFDHLPDAFDRLTGDPPAGTHVVLVASRADPAGPQQRIDPRYAALPAIPAAAEPDALRAALDALHAAATAFSDGDQRLFDALRHTFSPHL